MSEIRVDSFPMVQERDDVLVRVKVKTSNKFEVL
jgi:hypothetical protein